MKKLFLLGLTGLFLSGCGTASQQAEFWKHDTMYKNLDHFKYSIEGYKNTSPEDVKKTVDQEWFGEPVGSK